MSTAKVTIARMSGHGRSDSFPGAGCRLGGRSGLQLADGLRFRSCPSPFAPASFLLQVGSPEQLLY